MNAQTIDRISRKIREDIERNIGLGSGMYGTATTAGSTAKPLLTYGRVVTSHLLPRINPLKWWEKVLLWNPCNDFVTEPGMQVFVIPEHDLIIAPPGFNTQ